MPVEGIDGTKFDGVEFGTAPGDGYVIGTTPLHPLMLVNDSNREARFVGVKFYHHKQGDSRGKDRPPDGFHSMTMLVSDGGRKQRVWDVQTGQSVTVVLRGLGDYVAWKPGLRHSWEPLQASTMLTIRWQLLGEAEKRG